MSERQSEIDTGAPTQVAQPAVKRLERAERTRARYARALRRVEAIEAAETARCVSIPPSDSAHFRASATAERAALVADYLRESLDPRAFCPSEADIIYAPDSPASED